jgi:Family of unknown function (DUF6152)
VKGKLKLSFCLAVCSLMISIPALAHHGGSEYDQKNPITLKGTVTQYYWANPHCQIYLDVKDSKGKVVNWVIETLAPAVMKRAGWSSHLLHPGDNITITLAPSKNGTPVGMVRKLVLANGQEYGPGTLGEQPPQSQ